jgi:hypothetical protein
LVVQVFRAKYFPRIFWSLILAGDHLLLGDQSGTPRL